DQINEKSFAWIGPLLKAQPFIKHLELCRNPRLVQYNLNEFRESFFAPNKGRDAGWRLFETYYKHFRRAALPEDVAWLRVEDPMVDEARQSLSPEAHVTTIRNSHGPKWPIGTGDGSGS